LAPEFIHRTADRKGYCIQKPTHRPGWLDTILERTEKETYRVHISGADFNSRTEPLGPPRTWIESFRRDGATDCPNPH